MLCNSLSYLKIFVFIFILVEAIGKFDPAKPTGRKCPRSHPRLLSKKATGKKRLGRRDHGELLTAHRLSPIEMYQSGRYIGSTQDLLLTSIELSSYNGDKRELLGRSAMAMRPFRPTGPRQVTEYGLLRLFERARNDAGYLCALTNEIYYDEEFSSRISNLLLYPRPYPIEYPGVLDYMIMVLDEIPTEREQLIHAINQSETLRPKINRLIDSLGPVPLGSAGVTAPIGGLRRQKSSSSESSREHSQGSIRSHPVRLEDISSSSGSTYTESPRSGQGSGKSSPRSPRGR